MPPIRCRTEKLMSSVLGENWKDHNKLESTDESYMEIPNVQEQEMKSRPSQLGSTHQMSTGSAVVHVENETEIPEDYVLESQLFQLIEEHQPKSGTMLTHDNKDSDEDPFSDTDSVADPMYVPETSTSHYSDSDEPGVNDEPGHPATHCSENNKTHHSQNKETHHVMHPETEKASDPLNSDEHEQEKILTRKRKCTPASWKRNKQKLLRLQGKEHLSQKGNVVRGKSVQQVQCHCHYKCGEIFSLSDRQKIFDDYLSLPDERSRWSFISSCITKHEPKRRYLQIKTGTNEHSNDNTNVSRKKFTFAYSLTISGKKHRVCKIFFLATLDISGKKVETAIRKSDSSGVVEADKRGKNPAPNRISEERKDVVRNHIKSIPVTDSHYCRSSTKRKYLPSGLSEMRLYQDYVEFCKEHEIEPVNSSYYIHIFTNEFNYGFHRPKKDMCDYCTQFSNKSVNEQLEAKAEHELHLTRKQEVRDHKKEDKKHAKNDPTFHVYTMDMEKILLTPHLEVGQLYYKRKLKTFNFTVYNLADKQAINYMWHEANGTKGASEVSTCLWNLLKNLDPAVIEVTFFSDTAAGQNRNSILAAMFLRAVRDLPIQTINQKFMESGHSDMECDSVHSTIEGRAKHTSIFVPEGWYTVARTAKIDPPKYKVNEMHYKEFLDFKTYSQKQITNKNKAEDGEVMRWLDVKWLQFRKNDNTAIFYETQLSQLEFKKLTIRRTIRKVNAAADNNIVLPLYKNQLPIEKKKLEDLQQLCINGTIPSAYHDFYMKTLKSSVNDGASDESEVEDLENC